jgi:hypothetical protein
VTAELLRRAIADAARELSDLSIDLRAVERRIAAARAGLIDAAREHDREASDHDPRD